MSFDSGEELTEKTSPFDTFAQIIEGNAEIVIDNVTNLIQSGQGIIIPAHSPPVSIFTSALLNANIKISSCC